MNKWNNFNEQNAIEALKVSDNEMENNIGRHIKFLNPTCLFEKTECKIIGVQKLWNGSIGYRVISLDFNTYGNEDEQSGLTAKPNEIGFIIE